MVKDLRGVVDQAKMLLLIKNHSQILQEFIWHTEQLGMAGEAPGSAGEPKLSVTKVDAQKDKENALRGFRTLGMLIVTNG